MQRFADDPTGDVLLLLLLPLRRRRRRWGPNEQMGEQVTSRADNWDRNVRRRSGGRLALVGGMGLERQSYARAGGETQDGEHLFDYVPEVGLLTGRTNQRSAWKHEWMETQRKLTSSETFPGFVSTTRRIISSLRTSTSSSLPPLAAPLPTRTSRSARTPVGRTSCADRCAVKAFRNGDAGGTEGSRESRVEMTVAVCML